MLDLLQEIQKPYNLPFTILLILVLAYWIVALVGVADLDIDLDIDADTETDGSLFSSLTKICGFSEIPIILVLSLFSIFLWATNLLANQYFNPEGSIKIATILILPVIIISFIFTRLLVRPLAPLAKHLKSNESDAQIIGTVATVTTSSITHEFGRIEVNFDGRSLLLNAVLSEGDTTLSKGDEVLVVSQVDDSDTYIVRSLEPMLTTLK